MNQQPEVVVITGTLEGKEERLITKNDGTSALVTDYMVQEPGSQFPTKLRWWNRADILAPEADLGKLYSFRFNSKPAKQGGFYRDLTAIHQAAIQTAAIQPRPEERKPKPMTSQGGAEEVYLDATRGSIEAQVSVKLAVELTIALNQAHPENINTATVLKFANVINHWIGKAPRVRHDAYIAMERKAEASNLKKSGNVAAPPSQEEGDGGDTDMDLEDDVDAYSAVFP
jgi:hypothetical protein